MIRRRREDPPRQTRRDSSGRRARSPSHQRRTSPRRPKRTESRRPILAIPARVYKRWIFASIVLTFVASWFIIPFWFDSSIPVGKLGSLSDFLLESAIMKQWMPKEGIFGDDSFFKNITGAIRPFWSFIDTNKEGPDSPGHLLRMRGARAKFPVVLIPGITSTGLELWEGHACAKPYFRQRLWGTLTMMRFMILDSACWLQHLKLDPETGGDPANVKLRAAQGLEAADFLLPGFWVWARMIENLAEIGYDHSNLIMAAYDWRLDIDKLEQRDHYFSRLKSQIELLTHTSGEKVVALSHSLGGLVWFYFMKWVEATTKDPQWVDRHVQATLTIGAPYLGVPKAMSMIVSGEMRDTAQLGKFESLMLEMLMSKKERLSLFRTWGGGYAMLPKGGNVFWGNGGAGTLHDTPEGVGYGLINVQDNDVQGQGKRTFLYDDIGLLLDEYLPPGIRKVINTTYSDGGIASPTQVDATSGDPKHWTNPLQVPLPKAPGMKMYCFYGHGKDTERAYVYEHVPKSQWPEALQEAHLTDAELLEFQRSSDSAKVLIRIKLKLDAQDQASNLSTGIYHVDGDGTVPTLSNGYMCAYGWKHHLPHLNPANISIVTREYLDESVSGLGMLRGGPKTSDHVDILGNHEMTFDILKIVSGFEDIPPDEDSQHIVNASGEKFELGPVTERIGSEILKMARRIKLPF